MTVKNDLISIIIPSYNRATLLKRAIDSILIQKYIEIEILVVDITVFFIWVSNKDTVESFIKSIWFLNGSISSRLGFALIVIKSPSKAVISIASKVTKPAA